MKTKTFFLCGLILWLAAFPFVTSVLAASERHGQVKFGGLPIPGATVTASQGDKKLVTITDPQGVYSFPDLPDGVWTIEVEMLCFVPIKQDVTVGADAAIPDLELKLLPFDEIKAAAGPQPTPPVSVAINAPAPEPAKPIKPKKGAPPPAANTPGGFQRTDVNASKSDAAAQSNANAAAQSDNSAGNDDLNKRAADGFLINGTANNGAASPFATNPAFGNNRIGMRSLYTGNFGFGLDNAALDARPFSIDGQDTPKQQVNNFRGFAQVGGPVRLPGLTQKNLGNFFVGYQWIRNRNATTQPGTMPTAGERAGDFSQLSTPVIDPTTGLAFPGNMIPQTRISPQALSLLKLYPLPNFSGPYNYQLPLVSDTHQDGLNSNLNKSINRKNQVFGNFAFNSVRSDTPTLLGFTDRMDQLGLTTKANWRHFFTNRFYGTFAYQFSRQATTVTPNFANKENISGDAGILGNDQQPQNWGPPNLNFVSITPLTDGNQSVNRNQTSAVSADMFWNRGRHNVSFGGDFKRQQFNVISQPNPRGSFSFTGAAAGNDFADFLLGVPDTIQIASGKADKYLRGGIADAYVTDDVRISPSLTMNVGIRWEYWSPLSELQGRLVNLDVVPGFSAVAPVVANNPVGALTGAKYPDSLIHPDKHEFQPRIGLAWRPLPASSMLVKASYGVYYNTSVYQTIAQQMPLLSKSLSVQNSAADPLTLANGFNAFSNLPTLFGIDPNFRVGYSQNWLASVQRDLPGALIVTATYNGIKGTRGVQEFYPNTYAAGAANPCPTCVSGFAYMTSNGNSTREAGQIQLRRRLHNGFTASAQYVYSKSIDDAALGGRGQGTLLVAQNWRDLGAERGLSSFDQRHQATLSGQYTSGMGIGGGTLMSGWRAALFKEWTLLTNITTGTGLPLTPTYFAPTQGTGNTGSLRPEYTGAPLYNAPAGMFLNPAAYVLPPSGQYGNAGRDSITGPFQFSLNASLSRTFRLTDRFSLDLRVDSTNTLNHVTFQNWNTTFGSTQFGLPNPNSANAMRSMLTTLRVRF